MKLPAFAERRRARAQAKAEVAEERAIEDELAALKRRLEGPRK
ncbi:MAG: hypothetical protein AAGH15_24670 [Myxococcota bacterium]